MKKIVILALLLLILPSTALAQQAPKQEKENNKQEKQERAQRPQFAESLNNASIKNLAPTREALQQEKKQIKEEFKIKLQSLKNPEKKKLAEKIDNNLTAINEKRTQQMLKTLDRLDSILLKIKAKRASASASGANFTKSDAAIASAASALTEARTAVVTQSQKTYAPAAVSDTTIKQSMGTSMKQLQADLQTLHKMVIAAKRTLYQAAAEVRIAGKGTAVETTKAPSTSASPSLSPTISPTQVITETDDSTPIPSVGENY